MKSALSIFPWAGLLVLATAAPLVAANTVSESAAQAIAQAPGAHDDEAPLVGEQYTFIAASGAANSTFSATDYSYAGAGCMQVDGNLQLNGDFDLDVQLPDGVTIVYFRAFFYDNSGTDDVRASLFDFDGAGGYNVIGQVTSSGTPGYSSLGQSLSYVVDTYNHALGIRFENTTNTTGSSIRFCGARIMWAP